jgi:hypothetical protein
MRAHLRSGFAALLALSLSAGAPAAEPSPTEPAAQCPQPVNPQGALAPWSAPLPLGGGEALAVGKAARLVLLPAVHVRYALPPAKAPSPGTFGGVVEVAIDRAGTYRVALGSAAWIDLVADGEAVASIAHGHGPDCSGIRKVVDFTLQPGRHVLQLSGNAEAQTTVMVVRLP